MSYDSVETSVLDGSPYFLYQFARGATITRLTSDPSDLDVDGHTWTASPIAHNTLSQTGNIERQDIELTFPLEDSFAATYLAPLGQVTTLTIFRGHHADLTEELRTVWKGRILGSKSAEQKTILTCENVFTSMRRPGCHLRVQRTCRHDLYGEFGCTMDRTDFEIAATITGISGTTLTLTGIGASPLAYFAGGIVNWNGIMGFVVQHDSTTQLVLTNEIPGLQDAFDLSGSEDVLVAPGCNRTLEDCENKFANHLNFGGFRWLPSKNPFTTSIV